MKQGNSFLSYVHNFRGIAILYIVAGHSISAFDWQNSPFLERLTKMLLSNGTVFFVFIAGYLFQYLAHKYSAKKYFLTKLSSVLLPYFLISIPAIVLFVFFQTRESVWPGFYDNPPWLQVFYFYITGLHLAPLWFIPMITLFYIISPLLIVLDKHKWAYGALPFLIILSCYVPRGDVLQNFVHFLSVYIFGMYLSHNRIAINALLTKHFVLGFLVAIYLSLIYLEYLFPDILYLNYVRKMFLCCIFIGFLIKFNIDFKILTLLEEYSFGIFFSHSYIISVFKILEEKMLGHLLPGNLQAYFVFISIVALLCVLSIWIIKKILNNKSKYLIGC